jgi:hypothetical protein
MTEPGGEQPQEPTVSTEPPGTRRRRIPPHLGPARTSTVVLAVLWLALGVLYLNVRPETVETAPAGGGTSVETTQPPRTTTAPSTSTAPEPTTAETTTETPTSLPPSGTTPTTELPSESAVPTESTVPPTTSVLPEPTGETTPTG